MMRVNERKTIYKRKETTRKYYLQTGNLLDKELLPSSWLTKLLNTKYVLCYYGTCKNVIPSHTFALHVCWHKSRENLLVIYSTIIFYFIFYLIMIAIRFFFEFSIFTKYRSLGILVFNVTSYNL